MGWIFGTFVLYHIFPYYKSCVSITISIFRYSYWDKARRNSVAFYVLPLCISIFLVKPFYDYLNDTKDFTYEAYLEHFPQGIYPTKPELLELLTSPGDKFFQTSTNVEVYLRTDRMFASKADAVVPWFADVYEQEIIKDLSKDPPKVIFHNEENSVWGYSITTYAPNLNSWITANYTVIPIKVTQESNWNDRLYLSNDLDFDWKILDGLSGY